MDIIKDCKARIVAKASSKKQSNIIVTKGIHKLYVLTFASKVANAHGMWIWEPHNVC
jgi:hypothetical protein